MTGEGRLELRNLVVDFRDSLVRVDSTHPAWKSATTGAAYQAGIGPHPETEAVRLISNDMRASAEGRYGSLTLGLRYPLLPRQRCDLAIGEPIQWAVEVKLLRLFGDNGKPNDNMVMHVLSPYPQHRSALTDVSKLAGSGFPCRLAVLIYGFDYDGWAMDPAIDAFERLASAMAPLSRHLHASFDGLVHPVHHRGRVFAWEVGALTDP